MKVKFQYGKKVHWVDLTDAFSYEHGYTVYPIYTVCWAGGYVKDTDEPVTCKKCMKWLKENNG